MREPENIRQVAALCINWMGFIFYNKSPRSILNRDLRIEDKGLGDIKKVGVFVNATIEEMLETAAYHQLDYLQLHGNESPEDCYTLQKRGYALIKAFSVETEQDFTQTSAYEGRVDYFLFDTKCNSYGGSGKQFDWSVLAAYKGETPFLLSGGINPDSVGPIKNFTHPRFIGIDLNSGFETEPGLKDVEKIKSFIQEVS